MVAKAGQRHEIDPAAEEVEAAAQRPVVPPSVGVTDAIRSRDAEREWILAPIWTRLASGR